MNESFLYLLVLISFLLLSTTRAQDICYPDTCSDPELETFFSYRACCQTECCSKLRFFVIPASFIGVAFVLGAFFALCFQCR
ncbi:unnamed protein product [Auanema sp. JU1783]|nr:unnamed protein product [Auanema sp. JU1783]